jgi:hypothetical protein
LPIGLALGAGLLLVGVAAGYGLRALTAGSGSQPSKFDVVATSADCSIPVRCVLRATLHNSGGEGSGTATLSGQAPASVVGTEAGGGLAVVPTTLSQSCTTAIPRTGQGDDVDVSCAVNLRGMNGTFARVQVHVTFGP